MSKNVKKGNWMGKCTERWEMPEFLYVLDLINGTKSETLDAKSGSCQTEWTLLFVIQNRQDSFVEHQWFCCRHLPPYSERFAFWQEENKRQNVCFLLQITNQKENPSVPPVRWVPPAPPSGPSPCSEIWCEPGRFEEGWPGPALLCGPPRA